MRQSGRARMLANTRSYGPRRERRGRASHPPAGPVTSRPTPFSARSAAPRTDHGSMSVASTGRCSSRAAAIARMPEPVPRSRMRRGRRCATRSSATQAAARRAVLARAEGEAGIQGQGDPPGSCRPAQMGAAHREPPADPLLGKRGVGPREPALGRRRRARQHRRRHAADRSPPAPAPPTSSGSFAPTALTPSTRQRPVASSRKKPTVVAGARAAPPRRPPAPLSGTSTETVSSGGRRGGRLMPSPRTGPARACRRPCRTRRPACRPRPPSPCRSRTSGGTPARRPGSRRSRAGRAGCSHASITRRPPRHQRELAGERRARPDPRIARQRRRAGPLDMRRPAVPRGSGSGCCSASWRRCAGWRRG